MMHAKLVVDVGDNYCPKECLLDRPVLTAYNNMPVGPERMLNGIPKAGNMQHAKHTCLNHGNSMSVASRDNLVSARSQPNLAASCTPASDAAASDNAAAAAAYNAAAAVVGNKAAA
eukprot:1289897-Ditylum_brightwellii.AAC.1